jgi:hypothetical protein
MTSRIVSIAAATVIALGSANLRAQQSPPSQPSAPSAPPPPQQVVVPSLVPPKKAPLPPPPAPAFAAQRAVVPAAVNSMKRVGVLPDSVRPAAATKLAVRPMAAPPAPPAPQTTAARIAAAERSVAPANTAPIGATMRCRDGTYLTGAASAGRCANNGGVAAIYPAQPSAPTARPQPQRKQP